MSVQSDNAMLVYLGTPEGFGMAEGCYYNGPLIPQGEDTYGDSVAAAQKHISHRGFREWMDWAND